jgi:SPP1 gp7 family putative phage head morphogenesis protein
MNLADKFADELTKHDLLLRRYERGAIEQAMVGLRNLQGELVQAIKDLDPSEVTRTSAKRARLAKLLRRVDRSIDRAYNAAYKVQARELAALAEVESSNAIRTANRVVRAPLLGKGIPKGAAVEIVEGLIIPADGKGAPLRELMRQQAANLKASVGNALRSGVAQGRQMVDTLRIIRGNQALNFRDGVLFKSRAQAAALLRTAGSQVVNASRIATYQRNSDVIKGTQAMAVLDSRTSPTCLTRNGWAWHLSGQPFKGTPQAFGSVGSPPWHYNCRTTIVPIFKSLEALQGAVDDERLNKILEDLGDDFAIDGQPAQRLTFGQFMGRRSEADQQQMLGKGVWKLWKDGKIGLNDTIDAQGRPLTLRELKALIDAE